MSRFIRAPIDIGIEVTSRCNLDCPYCYAWEAPRQKAAETNPYPYLAPYEDPSFQHIEMMVEKLTRDAKPFEISYEGGEPFVRKDIVELIIMGCERICGSDIGFSVLSNGTLIKREHTEKIRELQQKWPGFSMQISLDSYLPKVDRLTRTGFDRALRTVRSFIDNEVDFVLSIVVHKGNIASTAESIDCFHRLGVRNVHLMNVMPAMRNYAERNYLSPSVEERRTFWPKLHEEYYGGRWPSLNLITSITVATDSGLGRQELLYEGCTAGVTRAAVKPNGDVITCSMVRTISLGNLLNQEWREIWTEATWNASRSTEGLLCYSVNIRPQCSR